MMIQDETYNGVFNEVSNRIEREEIELPDWLVHEIIDYQFEHIKNNITNMVGTRLYGIGKFHVKPGRVEYVTGQVRGKKTGGALRIE